MVVIFPLSLGYYKASVVDSGEVSLNTTWVYLECEVHVPGDGQGEKRVLHSVTSRTEHTITVTFL